MREYARVINFCIIIIIISDKIHHTQVNLIQLKTFELELDFAEYTYSTLMGRLRIFEVPPNGALSYCFLAP